MALVSGPGRGGEAASGQSVLHVDKHVGYIQSLDTVSGLGI